MKNKKNKIKKYKSEKLDNNDDDIKYIKNRKIKINNKDETLEESNSEKDDDQVYL